MNPVNTAKRNLSGLLSSYMGKMQREVLADCLKGEEKDGFAEIINELAQRISDMPTTYQTDGQAGEAIAYLHYFGGGNLDWWITEKDKDGGTWQAFGKADIGFGGELGYICIDELVDHPLIELDLYWTPKHLKEIECPT